MNLTNKIIHIKKLTMRQAKDFKKLFNDPSITQYLSIPFPLEMQWIKEYIHESMAKNEAGEKYSWAIFKSDLNQFVGVGVLKDLDQKNRLARLGYSIGKNYWNNGYTLMAVRLILKYAFLELNLNRIEIRIELNDERSLKLMEELKAVKEGVLRKALIYNEKSFDLELYSLLKDEYLSNLAKLYESHDMTLQI
jgi:RimJ/RimL family protein N-acetyltransferase